MPEGTLSLASAQGIFTAQMRVLVADDDPYSAAMLEAVLTSAGHECVMAKDGREAWAIIESVDAPRIAFLDWMMPEIDGIELCRRIRERKDAEYVYVAVLSVRSKQRDVTLGFQAGVDDYITKPYQIEDVLARLQVAERLVRSARVHNGLRRALAEAAASPGGDVIVRGDQRVGRIIFHHGKIAWAHISDVPGSLAAILADEPGITREDIREVIEECGVSGANFADLLVSWDLITRERLRTVLLNWIRAKIAAIASFSAPEVIFSPETRAAISGVLFAVEEVIAPELLGAPMESSLEVQAPQAAKNLVDLDADQTPRMAQDLERAIRIDGARSAAIFDLRDGQCLGARGETLDLDLVWSKLRLVSQSDIWEDLEDIMISTRRYIYILRAYTKSPPRTIFLALDRATATLGMARRALLGCIGE